MMSGQLIVGCCKLLNHLECFLRDGSSRPEVDSGVDIKVRARCGLACKSQVRLSSRRPCAQE